LLISRHYLSVSLFFLNWKGKRETQCNSREYVGLYCSVRLPFPLRTLRQELLSSRHFSSCRSASVGVRKSSPKSPPGNRQLSLNYSNDIFWLDRAGPFSSATQ
jgi:hypothetical protein